MTAASQKLLLTFLYGSDGTLPSGSAGLPAATQTYWLGKMLKGGFSVLPSPNLQTDPLVLGNSAIPQGFKAQKNSIAQSPLPLKVQPLDLVPFHVAMGKTEKSASLGSAFPDYKTSLNPTGDVPAVCWHREDNRLYSDQVREYYESKCTKQSVGFEDDLLTCDMEFLLQREYKTSMNQLTVLPIRRGNTSPVQGYCVRHPSLSCTWFYGTGDGTTRTLTSLFRGFSYTIEPKITPDDEEDGNDYAAALQAHASWKISDIILEVAMDPANQVLNALRAIAGDGYTGAYTTAAHTTADTTSVLQVTLPRRHINDYLQFRWNQVHLRRIEYPKEQAQCIDGFPTAKLVFADPWDIQVWERQCNAAGTSTYNEIATYEEPAAYA